MAYVNVKKEEEKEENRVDTKKKYKPHRQNIRSRKENHAKILNLKVLYCNKVINNN